MSEQRGAARRGRTSPRPAAYAVRWAIASEHRFGALAAAPRLSQKRAMNILLVGAGGAFGAICRYLVGVQAGRSLGSGWPYGTFAVNVLGGLLMGVLVGLLAHRGGADQEKWRLLLAVGALGEVGRASCRERGCQCV